MGNCLTVHPPPPNSIDLHLAPSTSTQLISASTQLSVTPSALLDPKCCTQLSFLPKTQHIRYLGGANSKSRFRFLKFFWPRFAQKWILRLAQNLFLGKFRPKKSKLSIFLNIGTHGILEVLILNLELEFQNSDPKIYFWANFNQNCCFWTFSQGFFKAFFIAIIWW